MRLPPRAATRSRTPAVLAAALTATLLTACVPDNVALPSGTEHLPSSQVTAAPGSDFCPVAVPQSWQDAFRDGRLPRKPGERWVALAPAPDGRSAFATVQRDGLPALLVKQERNGDRRIVTTMPDRFTLPLLGEFDGRWLVYARTDLRRPAPHAGGDAEIFVWDAQTGGEPRQVTGAVQGARPFHLYDGKLAVTRVVDQYRTEVAVHDLAAGTARRVAVGRVSAVGFRGADLLWHNWSERRLNTFRPSGSTVSRHGAFLGRVEAPDMTTDGRTMAWISPGEGELNVWRWDWNGPVRVLSAALSTPVPASGGPAVPPSPVPPAGGAVSRVARPAVVGDLVVFQYNLGWYVADLRTGSYARLTADHAEAAVSGSALLMNQDDNSVPAERHAYSLLLLDRLPPLPACP
ncbi:TolB family protein [Micromonospora sp. LA-10]|uniref:TolB family protein n=1 Tax=Micromonospora sp. LA-10 TaxID=3446364 RepID=UPI003490CEED